MPSYYQQNISPNDKNQNISIDEIVEPEIVEPETTATPNNDSTSPPPPQRQKSIFDPIITTEIDSTVNFESNEPEKNNESILSFHESYLGSATTNQTQTSDKNKKAKTQNQKKIATSTTTTTKTTKRKDKKQTSTKTKKAKFCDMNSTDDSTCTFLPDVQSTLIHEDSVLFYHLNVYVKNQKNLICE